MAAKVVWSPGSCDIKYVVLLRLASNNRGINKYQYGDCRVSRDLSETMFNLLISIRIRHYSIRRAFIKDIPWPTSVFHMWMKLMYVMSHMSIGRVVIFSIELLTIFLWQALYWRKVLQWSQLSTEQWSFVWLERSHTKRHLWWHQSSLWEDTPSYDVNKCWHRQFWCVRKSLETAPIPGRPHSAIEEDTVRQWRRRFTACQLAHNGRCIKRREKCVTLDGFYVKTN